MHLDDACSNDTRIPAHLAALRLFGEPALEQCGPEEFAHARRLAAAARQQAQWLIESIEAVDTALEVLELAGREGRQW